MSGAVNLAGGGGAAAAAAKEALAAQKKGAERRTKRGAFALSARRATDRPSATSPNVLVASSPRDARDAR